MGLADHFRLALADLAPDASVYVAYSGGLDSSCLLHLASGWAAEHGRPVTALHLNHGLSANADSWQAFCERQCRRFGVPLKVKQSRLGETGTANLEQRARDARYAWFESLLDRKSVLLMAHHRDDQAETLLLRMLRGSGTRGLSGIPGSRPLGRGRVVRPLLEVDRETLHGYAAGQGLEWIEDESNLSLDHDRNYLRHEIMPRLASRWPHVVEQFTRVTRHLREERALLQALADEDARSLQQPQAASFLDRLPPLDLIGFRDLDPARQRNLLQSLVQQVAVHPLPRDQQLEWLRQLARSGPSSQARLRHENLVLALHRDHLHFLDGEIESVRPAKELQWRSDVPLLIEDLGISLNLREMAESETMIRQSEASGSEQAFEPGDRLRVHWRRGGERVTLPGENFSRALKQVLQSRQVAPWLRRIMPLVSCDGRLVWSAVLGDLSPRLVDSRGRTYSFELGEPKRKNNPK